MPKPEELLEEVEIDAGILELKAHHFEAEETALSQALEESLLNLSLGGSSGRMPIQDLGAQIFSLNQCRKH